MQTCLPVQEQQGLYSCSWKADPSPLHSSSFLSSSLPMVGCQEHRLVSSDQQNLEALQKKIQTVICECRHFKDLRREMFYQFPPEEVLAFKAEGKQKRTIVHFLNHQCEALLPSRGGKQEHRPKVLRLEGNKNAPVWKLHWGLVISARPVSEAFCSSWSRARYCCWACGPSSDSSGLFKGKPCFWKVNFRPPSCYTHKNKRLETSKHAYFHKENKELWKNVYFICPQTSILYRASYLNLSVSVNCGCYVDILFFFLYTMISQFLEQKTSLPICC